MGCGCSGWSDVLCLSGAYPTCEDCPAAELAMGRLVLDLDSLSSDHVLRQRPQSDVGGGSLSNALQLMAREDGEPFHWASPAHSHISWYLSLLCDLGEGT